MSITDISAIVTLGLFPDFPAVGDVRDSTEYATGDATGTLDVSGEDAPTAPTFTASVSGDDLTVTVDGDADVTNTVYYKAVGDLAWTASGRSGDGDVTISDLDDGSYLLTVVSSTAGGTLSLPAIGTISTIDTSDTDISDSMATAGAAIINAIGVNITYIPFGGTQRTIKAIVEYGGYGNIGSSAGSTYKNSIGVIDSATVGISRTEFKPTQDKVIIPLQTGGTATRLLVNVAAESDEDIFIVGAV
ncbi:MAG: hypothetical protein GY869_03210 [Planctomycetes bacterium]|nr:hypothetical protein [Planctomycetota bacterium]